MPIASPSPASTSCIHRVVLLGFAITQAFWLSGCSVWPQVLSFSSAPIAVEAQPTPSTASVTCRDCTLPDSANPPMAPAAKVPAAADTTTEVATAAIPSPATPEPIPRAALQAESRALQLQPIAASQPTAAPDLAPGFYVNVGLFAVPANANRAQQTLETAKLPVLVGSVQSTKGSLIRVRVGPFTTRVKANAAAKKIRALKLGAIVFQH